MTQEEIIIVERPAVPGADVSNSAFAIHSGGHADAPTPGNAFDNNTGTRWASSVTGGAVSGSAYIGQSFGAGNEQDIIQVALHGIASSFPGYHVTSVLVQYSDNGSAWTTGYTWKGITDATTLQVSPQFASAGVHGHWRLLANSNGGSGSYWSVWEVEFRPAT